MHQSELLNDFYNYSSSSQCPNQTLQQHNHQQLSQPQPQPFTSNNNIYQPALISQPQQIGRQLFQQQQQNNNDLIHNQSHQQRNSNSTARNNNNDMSLYSPSSSTSLLYHVYDQINLPNEQNYQSQQQNNHNLPVISKANNTTVLNPANLFGSSNVQQNTNNNQNNSSQHFQLPLAMQLHQSKPSNDLHNYSSLSQYQSANQPPPFSNTLHHNQSSFGQQQLQTTSTNGLTNPLIDAFMVHNNTNGNNNNSTPNGQNRLIPMLAQRQLSSSGGSSTLSAHSIHQSHQNHYNQTHLPQHQITYGRHLRQVKTISSKSSSNLASVLQQSSNTLSHLTGFDASGRVVTTINPSGIKPHLFANNINDSPNQWRFKKSAKHYLIQYQGPIKFIILVLLLTLTLLTIVRYFSSSTNASNNNNLNNMSNSNLFAIRDVTYTNQLSTSQHAQNPAIPIPIPSQPTSSSNSIFGNINTNPYDTIDPSIKPISPINPYAVFPNQVAWTPQASPIQPSAPSTTSTTTTTTTPSTVVPENNNQATVQSATIAKCQRCVQNGGRCGQDGRCHCPAGFYGPQCKPLPVQSITIDSKCQRLNGSTSDDCVQPIERQCDDKIDNDNDGLVDCADSECCSDKACQDSSLCMKSPDPRDILMRKPPMPPTSSFFQRMQFLIEKSSSQYHSNLKDFNDSRASVIRGRVMYMRKGMTGVRVSVAGSTNLGMTLSRDGGYFDLMVNGGGAVLVEFRREPFAIHQRAVRIPWNEIVLVDPIELVLDNSTSSQQTRIISPSTNTFDQDQSACFAHNYQLMRPQIIASPKSSSISNKQATSSILHKQQNARSIARAVILKDSALVQETILLPGGQFTNPSSTANHELSQASSGATSSSHQANNVALVYISSKSMEFMSTINLQLVPASSDHFKLPDELKQIHLKIVIEGNLFEQTFEPNYNLNYTYAWNRRNVYTQKCFGLSNAIVSVGYEYFDCQHLIWSTKQIQLPGYDLSISDIGQQWNLNIHHRYNYRDSILQRGDGQNFNLKADKPKIVVPLIGDTYQRQTLCPYCDGATAPPDQRLLKPQTLVSSPDGSLYVGDFNLIRRIESQQANQERLVRTILEFPMNRVPSKYSLALNIADSSKLYMTDADHYQVYAIRESSRQQDSDMTPTASQLQNNASSNHHLSSLLEEQLIPVAGTGEKCQPDDPLNCGDGQLARLARLVEPKAVTFDLSGRMYIADGRNVRMVDLDQKIYTLLGNYVINNDGLNSGEHSTSSLFPCTGEAIPTHKYSPKNPVDLAINPIDDSLYILDNNVVYRMTQDKRIQIVAGRLIHCPGAHSMRKQQSTNAYGSGVEATGIHLQGAQSITFASNGDLYISEEDQDRSIARVLIMSPSDENTIRIFAGLSNTQPASPPSDHLSKPQEPNIDSVLLANNNVNGELMAPDNNKRASNFLSASTTSRANEYKFNSISAICIDQQAKLIIADRIQLRLVSIETDLPQINQAGEYELQSPENGDEILVFNRYGHHVATKELLPSSPSMALNGSPYKFTFTYSVNSPFGQLSSVLYSSGNKISIYREGPQHIAKMIETSFGGQLKLDSSKQVNSITITQPNATKINLAYQSDGSGGLLKHSYDQASGELYEIQYDEFGRATGIHFTSSKLSLSADCRLNNSNAQGYNKPTEQLVGGAVMASNNHMAAMLINPKVHHQQQQHKNGHSSGQFSSMIMPHHNHHQQQQQQQQSPLCSSLIVQD